MARTPSDLRARTLSAVAVGVVVLAALLSGVWGLAAAVAVVCVLACREVLALARPALPRSISVASLAGVVAMPFAAALGGAAGLTAVLSALLVVTLLLFVTTSARLADAAAGLAAAVYVGLSLSHLVLLRQMPHGLAFALLAIAGVWADDVLAYLVGSYFGAHALAPRISPHKSWEGVLAGAAGMILVWTLAAAALGVPLTIAQSLLVGAAASAAAVFGDLAESRIKRETGVKDSGTLLPGHGGILDRFDSLIMVSVVVYHTLGAMEGLWHA